MIKKIALIVGIIAVLASVVLFFDWYEEAPIQEYEDEPLGDTTDEIVNEMADYILNENDEIEIGEMT